MLAKHLLQRARQRHVVLANDVVPDQTLQGLTALVHLNGFRSSGQFDFQLRHTRAESQCHALRPGLGVFVESGLGGGFTDAKGLQPDTMALPAAYRRNDALTHLR